MRRTPQHLEVPVAVEVVVHVEHAQREVLVRQGRNGVHRHVLVPHGARVVGTGPEPQLGQRLDDRHKPLLLVLFVERAPPTPDLAQALGQLRPASKREATTRPSLPAALRCLSSTRAAAVT